MSENPTNENVYLFKSIHIKNFRTFKETKIDLCDKNVIFGLNDIGKTNFLYALQFLFDYNIRKNNFQNTDYFHNDTNNPIEITITLDERNSDFEIIRSKMKGAMYSGETPVVIKLKGEYDSDQSAGLISMQWGNNSENIQDIPIYRTISELDRCFTVNYIDSEVNLDNLFKKHTKDIFDKEQPERGETAGKIKKNIEDLNKNISSLPEISKFESEITESYKNLRDEKITIKVKSEISVSNLYSKIKPYLSNDGEDMIYPTSGDGRRKLLSYALYNLMHKDNQDKIELFLIEEPENHLHKSLQVALSNYLFNESCFKYFFITTHSPFILFEMDNVNLIRLFNTPSIGKNCIYIVPSDYHKNKLILNREISEAIFANKVMLVEGESERILFEHILNITNPKNIIEDYYILPVNGVGFENYYNLLIRIGIWTVIKTDNDCNGKNDNRYLAGFERLNKYLEKYDHNKNKINDTKVTFGQEDVGKRRAEYSKRKSLLKEIQKNHPFYISSVDLENDLIAVDENFFKEKLNENPVHYLQLKKQTNMVKLLSCLDVNICNKILEDENFECIRRLIDGRSNIDSEKNNTQ